METIRTDFDLNALRILVALDSTRSVSRAAEAMDMSQSGFSTALARLRERLGDELFVRVASGMEPTVRACAMVQVARQILSDVESHILEQPVFDPATAKAEFRLSMADVAELVYLPRLVAHLQSQGPGLAMTSSTHTVDELRDQFESGRVDLAIGYFPDLEEAGGFMQQKLYVHTFACIVRKRHPVLEQGLSKAAYIGLGHAVVASPARTNQVLERTFERQHVKRRVVVRTPHSLSVPIVIGESDLIATVPLAVASYFARLGVVEMLPLPFRPPQFEVRQYWHVRSQRDPRQQWFRQQVAALFLRLDPWAEDERALYGARAPGR